MEYRNLEVTIISAEDLKNVSTFGKMRTYAVVSVDPHYRQETDVDRDGGTKPSWNQKLSFIVPEPFFQDPSSHLMVKIHSKGPIVGDKFVGVASIPLSDFVQSTNPEGVVTYQVRRRSGKVKGSLRLMTRVGEKKQMALSLKGTATVPYAQPVSGYPGQSDVNSKAEPYGYPPAVAPPAYCYPHTGYPASGYPPAGYPQQAGYGGYPQGNYYPQQQQYGQPPPRRPGMGGMGLGTGLLAGALGGLILGDLVSDATFDGGFDGGFGF